MPRRHTHGRGGVEQRMIAAAGIVSALAAIVPPREAEAREPFDFLFGAPAPRHAVRAHRPALREADVPLPPPRPHFADDTPAAARSIPSPGASPAAPPPRSVPAPDTAAGSGTAIKSEAKPERAEAPAASATPLPPEKPASLGTTETPAPAASPVPAPSPGDTKAPLPPKKPEDLATPQTPATPPAVAPSGANTAFNPRQPDDDATCPARLEARKVQIEPVNLGPQPDDRCTIVRPVRLIALTRADGSSVAFPDKPTIACTTAEAFSAYVGDLLFPLAKGTFGSPLASVATGPGFECRSRDHIVGAKLSAHGQGLAVDIAQMKLADGRTINVGEPGDAADQAFETAARAGGCGYFHTALGPGTDSYHKTHWHFDLEVRGASGDAKYCK